jgi:two-component system OmpR family sensor kinase
MRLRQALDNLLDNALRHSPPGGVLEVRAYTDGGTAWIVVSDDGPGFPDGTFADGGGAPPSAESDLPPGGLGLAIVRAVTEAHGGTLDLRRRPEGGARAALAVPVRPEQRDPPEPVR